MAKNVDYDPRDTARQQENIRKAKGNPNKNIHHRRNGSNYGGYASAPQKTAATAEREREPLFDAPRPAKIFLAVLAAVTLVLMIVWRAAFRDSVPMFYLVSTLMGLACCIYAYFSYQSLKRRKSGPVRTVIVAVVALLGVVYLLFGARGLLALLGI